MIKKYKNKLLLLAIILFIIAFIIIVLSGKAFIYKVKLPSYITNVEQLKIEIKNDNIIKIVDKKIYDNNLLLKLESINPGKVYVDIGNEEFSKLESFYVHPLGTITQDTYFGICNNDVIIPIFAIIYTLLILILLIIDYIESIKENMYLYKNITYLGFIIFFSSTITYLLIQLFNYNGIIGTLKNVLLSFSFFSIIIFPIAFIVSILVIISNLKLIKKEGFTWKNTLGIMLSFLVIIATFLPEVFNNYTQSSTFIDFHNEQSIAPYIQDFLGNTIYLCLTYLECILLATIILSIKAAKHIPEYNKDYIIILGCMIKKDGSLTSPY